MVEVKRKDGESYESLLRRFSRKVQQSGVLIKSRKLRFKEDKKTKREKQDAAVRRAVNLKERERLFKLGKLES